MPRYERYKIVDIETVLELARNGKNGKKMKGARTQSLRMQTFATKGICCAYCNLEASFFAVEKNKGSQSDKHHFNLWGIRNGKEVLFTHDHVHARALGGADEIDNAVTACENCNSNKSKYENRILEEIKTLKISVDFEGLIGIVKNLYKEPHIRKFWFIEA